MIEFIDHFILEPLSYPFIQRAMIGAIMIGMVCALFSCFLVLKGWALMGDAVSHAVLPGLALSYIAGIPLIIGAFAGGLFCALVTGYLKAYSRVKEDAIMGIVFSGMFALGLVMITQIETDLHILHILFGNILGITNGDLVLICLIASFCSLIMIIKRRDFMLYCFDAVHAGVMSLKTKTLYISLLIMLALTIVAALKAAGIILVIAMLIAPGAIGFLLCQSFDKMLVVAITAAIVSSMGGTLFSFHLDVATAPLIVVIQAGLFIAALAFTKIYRPKVEVPA